MLFEISFSILNYMEGSQNNSKYAIRTVHCTLRNHAIHTPGSAQIVLNPPTKMNRQAMQNKILLTPFFEDIEYLIAIKIIATSSSYDQSNINIARVRTISGRATKRIRSIHASLQVAWKLSQQRSQIGFSNPEFLHGRLNRFKKVRCQVFFQILIVLFSCVTIHPSLWK